MHSFFCKTEKMTISTLPCQVCLTASDNPDNELKTSIATLTYKDEIQQVPIPQPCIISIVDVYSYDFQEHGGSRGFL